MDTDTILLEAAYESIHNAGMKSDSTQPGKPSFEEIFKLISTKFKNVVAFEQFVEANRIKSNQSFTVQLMREVNKLIPNAIAPDQAETFEHFLLDQPRDQLNEAPKPPQTIEERYNRVTSTIYVQLQALRLLMATPEYKKLFASNLEFTDSLDEKNLYGSYESFVEDLKNFRR